MLCQNPWQSNNQLKARRSFDFRVIVSAIEFDSDESGISSDRDDIFGGNFRVFTGALRFDRVEFGDF